MICTALPAFLQRDQAIALGSPHSEATSPFPHLLSLLPSMLPMRNYVRAKPLLIGRGCSRRCGWRMKCKVAARQVSGSGLSGGCQGALIACTDVDLMT